jgi:hypothetical protein
VEDFLSWKPNYNNEIEIFLLGRIFARFPVEECEITLHEETKESKKAHAALMGVSDAWLCK